MTKCMALLRLRHEWGEPSVMLGLLSSTPQVCIAVCLCRASRILVVLYYNAHSDLVGLGYI